jgi:alanine-alpha-ketoisovalerate/valine-pyruvate aminotransferase|tara:strand:- start:6217 stop:6465 length:249 start_codon:yes stop_codon:yes gene_type:complete
MGKGCRVLHKDCDPTLGQDKSLPYTAYMVEYLEGGLTKFDIVSASKQVDIFDEYWDKYHQDFKNMTQTEGRVNPKMWNPKKK